MARRLTSERRRTQPGIKGHPRLPVGSRVNERIERAIRREQERYGVSRSWVIAQALAFTFNIREDEKDKYK